MARKTPKADAHQIVTDAVIAYLEECEAGNAKGQWTRPWTKLLTDNHYCPFTNKAYAGTVNIMSLSVLAWKRNFSSLAWGTYKQWKELGTDDKPVSVKKGAKSCYIFVPMIFSKKDASGNVITNSSGDEVKGLSFKQVPVFNADEVDGYTEIKPEIPPCKVVDDVVVDKFIARLGIDITFTGDRAFYSVTGDHVTMPIKEAFNDTPHGTATEAFYGVQFHEMIHATGHESRCKRPLANGFGSEAYAAEELVAEMGAAILCHMYGVSDSPRADHAQYIKSWLKALKNDKRMIFKACGQAQKAIKWMEGKQPA